MTAPGATSTTRRRPGKRVALALALAVAGVAAAIAIADPASTEQYALTAIDTVPSQAELTRVLAGPAGSDSEAQAELILLAQGSGIAQGSGVEVGIRLRAIHALAKYCLQTINTKCDPGIDGDPTQPGDPAHAALVALIAANASAHDGTDVLILRAAIEALGELRVADDVVYLIPLLNHASRDVRAATATALRDLCNTTAITPLRQRYSHEMVDQVKLAISEALRILGQSPSACSVN